MAIKARGEFTVSVVNDGRGEKTYIRYSDDNGKTFTKAVPLKTTGEMFAGRNIFAVNAGLFAEAGAVLDSSIHGVKCTKTKSLNRVGQLFKRFADNLPRGQFRISGRMKTDGTTFSVNVNMGGVNAGDVIATSEWKNFSLVADRPGYSDAPNYCFVDFRYGMTQPAATTLNLYIADLMITQGNTQYDYAPAPEDQQFGLTPGKYIGIMSWDKPYPPLDPSAYTWSAFQGQDAELYRLNPLEESAIVGNDGACKVILRYNVTYIAGSKASKYTGDDITIKVDSRLGALNFTKKATGEWECVTTIADFAKKQLGSFNVSVMKGAQVLDTRVIPVTYATQALLEANQKLGEVVASVKGVSKLIHNMFVGSTFLEPIEGVWSMNGASVDKNVKYNNANVVFIEEHGQAADTYHSLMFVVEGCAPKKKYTISAMVRTDNLGSFTNGKNGAGLEVVMVDNGNRVRLFDPISIVPAKANEWQKFEHTFTTPDNLTSQKLEVKFVVWRNGRLWVSQPMMNAGEVAADYTANVKDIQLSLTQIKLTANTISQTVTDLSTGIEQAGIHIDGANSEITLNADKTKFVDRDGETAAFIKDGKVNAKAIDADKVVADGIQSKTIDAKEATFENINIKGNLKGVSGSFRRLKCVDDNGNEAAALQFGKDNAMTIEGGDLFMQGTKNERSLRFYSSDIWCRGMFGHVARTCAVIKNDIMHVYVGEKGEDGEEGVKVKLSTVRLTSGETVYRIPMFSPGTGYYADDLFGTLVNPSDPKFPGAPIDVIVFNCNANLLYTFVLLEEGKTWTVINGNDGQTVRIADIGGWRDFAGGTTSNYFYVNPKWLNPYQANTDKLGRGVLYAGSWDSNWSA